MFNSLSRSWKFAKMSYSLIGQNKRLILFPLISTIAAIIVFASFLIPLWQTGMFESSSAEASAGVGNDSNILEYLIAFIFYFCNYFVIVFFNTGLIACTLKIISGEDPDVPVSYGIRFALQRLSQIVGWALISAFIGVILKVIEGSHKKAGELISSLLGSAWTALTYFVVPYIVVEGSGPIEAFKRSANTLKKTWGTALVGNFSMGLFAFLITLPFLVIIFILFSSTVASSSFVGMIFVGALGFLLIVTVGAVTSAADAIFKTYLYVYATGKNLPADIDTAEFAEAFRQKD